MASERQVGLKDLLEGKVALVTGAGRGNGAAIALGLAQSGATVVVTDVDSDAARRTAQSIVEAGGRAEAFPLDVSSLDDCLAIASEVGSRHGALDILVNNAGIILRGFVGDEHAVEHWSATMRVNVDGPFLVTRAFLDLLKRNQGCVVNVASIQSFVALPSSAAYTASKGAVKQLTKALATELARFGIRVNAIAPGAIETDMTAETRSTPKFMSTIIDHTPMRRFGRPEELVGPVIFLASKMSAFVTGVVLPVDGGFLAL